MRVHVIMHGRHQNSKRWLRHWSAWQTKAGYRLSIDYTQFAGHAAALASEAINQPVDILVAAGGDGTLNECVNGYLKANGKIPMTFMAMGTGNDYLKTLQQSGQWKEVHDLIVRGKTQWMDVGQMDFKGLDGSMQNRYFINVMDVGLGGEVVQKIAHSKRRLGPFLTYQKAVISSLIEYKRTVVNCELDNVHFESETLMLVVANAKWFGSGLGIAPLASLNDGVLEVIHIGNITLLDYLIQLPKVRQCRVLKHKSIHYYTSKCIAISTPGLPIDCDGEFIGFTPLNCQVLNSKLKVLVH